MNHTPAPWKWADNYQGLLGPGNTYVLEYADYEGMWVPAYRNLGKQDAALIANSPNLLGILIKVECLMTGYCAGHPSPLLKEIRQVIAESTGESS